MSDDFDNELPWLNDSDDDNAGSGSESDGLADVSWDSTTSQPGGPAQQDPTKGLTGQLPWNAQASDPQDNPDGVADDAAMPWQQATPAAPEDDLASFLDANEPEAPSFDFGTDDTSPAESAAEFDFARLEPSEAASPDASLVFGTSDPAPPDDDFVSPDFDFFDEPPSDDSFDLDALINDEQVDVDPLVMNSAADGGDLPDWLSDSYDEMPAPDSAETPVNDGLDWMGDADPDALDSEGDAAQTYEEWAAQNAVEDDADDLNWMAQDVTEFSDTADTDFGGDDLTYEEWERQQNEAELAETQPPEPEMPMPDWFDEADEIPTEDGAAVDGDSYIPEWYMGVEELDDADAPDWLKDMNAPADTSPPPAASDLDDLPMPDDGLGFDLDDLPMPDTDDVATPEPPAPSGPIRRLGSSSQPTPDTPEDDLLSGLDLGDMPDSEADFNIDNLGLDAQDDFSLDDLLGDSSLPDFDAPEDDPSTLVLPADSLGFDDDFLSEFEPIPDELAADAAVAAESDDFANVDLEPADLELSEAENLPEWMSRLGGTGDAYTLSVGGVKADREQVNPLALPEDLRNLREQQEGLTTQSPKGDAVTSGPLLGVEGALDLKSDLLAPGNLVAGQTFAIPDEQAERLAALRQVLETVQAETRAQKIDINFGLEADPDLEDVDKAEAAARPKRRAKAKRDRLPLMLVLLVFALLPFLADAFHVGSDIATELDEDAQPLALAVDALADRPDDARVPVLVAFEYGPTAALELDPLAEAVLRDIVTNGGQPVMVSTNPMGTLHAQGVMHRLANDSALLTALGRLDRAGDPVGFMSDGWLRPAKPADPTLQSPDDYALLRYVSGGAVGVQALVQSTSTNTFLFARTSEDEALDFNGETLEIDDFAFVVVIAERYDDSRIWAEQFGQVDMPKFALVTAAAEPATRPYLEAGEFSGMLSGLRGALTYDAVRNIDTKAPPAHDSDLPDPTISQWHAAAVAMTMAVLFILLGMFFNILRGYGRVRRSIGR